MVVTPFFTVACMCRHCHLVPHPQRHVLPSLFPPKQGCHTRRKRRLWKYLVDIYIHKRTAQRLLSLSLLLSRKSVSELVQACLLPCTLPVYGSMRCVEVWWAEVSFIFPHSRRRIKKKRSRNRQQGSNEVLPKDAQGRWWGIRRSSVDWNTLIRRARSLMRTTRRSPINCGD